MVVVCVFTAEMLFLLLQRTIFLCRNKEKRNEKNVSTQEKTKKQSSRIPCKNEDNRRQKNACKKKKQGSSFSFRLISGQKLEVYLQA